MKVLWVCNIMLPVIARQLGLEASNKEGWLDGLAGVILARQAENRLELGVAFPVKETMDGLRQEIRIENGALLKAYGFYEDVDHAETYDPGLEERLKGILEDFAPDVIHCFGTEYGHTLAVLKAWERTERILVSLQGLCSVCAQAYMADLPERVQRSLTFRDWLKKDSIRQQQEKFALRGKREEEVIRKASHVAGRTGMDAFYVARWNPGAVYHPLNETLRKVFYEGRWPSGDYEPHTIFMSQGDYPLKGLHYMLRALDLIRKTFPEAKLVVAGNNLTAYESLKDKIKLSAYGKYLRKLMAEYELWEAVNFRGRLTAEEMKEQFLRCGLYVCCSSVENSPNSLGEAMLLGVPCVAADVGGIPSLFEDGKDGILYRGFRSGEIAFYEKKGREEQDDQARATEAEGRVASAAGSEERDGQALTDGMEGRDGQVLADGSDGRNGRILATEAEGRVAAALADAVLKMFRQEDRQEYCRNARAHARKTHDGEANYRQLLKIYDELAPNSQNPGPG